MRLTRTILAATVVAVCVVWMAAGAAQAEEDPRTLAEMQNEVADDGETIDVFGTQTTPGSDGGEQSNSQGSDGAQEGPAKPRGPFDDCTLAPIPGDEAQCIPHEQEAPAEAEPAIPAFTITDAAQFAPAPTTVAGEPSNAGVAGLPTNFVATASVSEVAGSILGFPLTVRFTPVGFDFEYGDGESQRTTTGGYTWESEGLPQFTPTPTSHTYSERGTYVASVTVFYAAEVNFGTGWMPVDGEVSSAGAGQEIRIYEATTALVKYTCIEDPDGIGCP